MTQNWKEFIEEQKGMPVQFGLNFAPKTETILLEVDFPTVCERIEIFLQDVMIFGVHLYPYKYVIPKSEISTVVNSIPLEDKLSVDLKIQYNQNHEVKAHWFRRFLWYTVGIPIYRLSLLINKK